MTDLTQTFEKLDVRAEELLDNPNLKERVQGFRELYQNLSESKGNDLSLAQACSLAVRVGKYNRLLNESIKQKHLDERLSDFDQRTRELLEQTDQLQAEGFGQIYHEFLVLGEEIPSYQETADFRARKLTYFGLVIEANRLLGGKSPVEIGSWSVNLH